MAKRRLYRRRPSYRARFRRWRRHHDLRVPIVPTLALVSTVITPCPSGRSILQDAREGNFENLLYDAREKYAGIDNKGGFQWSWLLETWGPVVAGALISRFAGRFVNPTISKIPLVGKYIKL